MNMAISPKTAPRNLMILRGAHNKKKGGKK
jgi:hypothetical protein